MPNEKLEGSSVMYSVVGKLFVECFDGVFVLVSWNLEWCWCGFSGDQNLVHSTWSRRLTFWLIKALRGPGGGGGVFLIEEHASYQEIFTD